jgi:hypothetical protein
MNAYTLFVWMAVMVLSGSAVCKVNGNLSILRIPERPRALKLMVLVPAATVFFASVFMFATNTAWLWYHRFRLPPGEFLKLIQ